MTRATGVQACVAFYTRTVDVDLHRNLPYRTDRRMWLNNGARKYSLGQPENSTP